MEKPHEQVQCVISGTLDKVEADFGVKILFAVESGSRAWDFASHDSDYDVRFIYALPAKDYLRLDKVRDVIELPIQSKEGFVLDVNGWDVKKALRLAHASNPVLFEWFSSPIVYRTSDKTGELASLLEGYFSPQKATHHYLSMARRTYKAYFSKQEVPLKKYFYVLRPVFAAQYVAGTLKAPPMRFCDLMLSQCPRLLLPAVTDLLERKRGGLELGVAPRIASIDRYIEEALVALDATASTLEGASAKDDWQPINGAFLKIIGMI